MGLIQREIESRGIRTAAIAHLPKVIEKSRPPRILTVDYPLGLTFGYAYNKELQRSLMLELLDLAMTGGQEEVRVSKHNGEVR